MEAFAYTLYSLELGLMAVCSYNNPESLYIILNCISPTTEEKVRLFISRFRNRKIKYKDDWVIIDDVY